MTPNRAEYGIVYIRDFSKKYCFGTKTETHLLTAQQATCDREEMQAPNVVSSKQQQCSRRVFSGAALSGIRAYIERASFLLENGAECVERGILYVLYPQSSVVWSRLAPLCGHPSARTGLCFISVLKTKWADPQLRSNVINVD